VDYSRVGRQVARGALGIGGGGEGGVKCVGGGGEEAGSQRRGKRTDFDFRGVTWERG